MKIDSFSPTIRRKEMDAVLTTMVQERIGPGEQAQKLIQYARELIGYEHCIALRSPVMALYYALKALSLPSGCEVVISALSPSYYYCVICDAGYIPIYADVDELGAQLTVESVQAVLSPQTGAIVVHHALGYVPDVPALIELGIPVIEDCSRSYGSHWLEKRSGSFASLSILALEERDILTAGGGALLYAMNKREASVLRQFKDLPMEYLLPDMNAALAWVQFREDEKNRGRRREIAMIFRQASARTRHRSLVQQGESEYNNYTFALVLETGLKDVKQYASRKEVSVEAAFDDTVLAVHPLETSHCPNANSLILRTVRFPLYPRLKQTEIAKISKVLASLP